MACQLKVARGDVRTRRYLSTPWLFDFCAASYQARPEAAIDLERRNATSCKVRRVVRLRDDKRVAIGTLLPSGLHSACQPKGKPL
jgi:hypothetical protein